MWTGLVRNSDYSQRKTYRIVILPDGGMEASTAAETFEDHGDAEVESGELSTKELGRGKRKKKPNTLYNQSAFWRHNDSSDSEID